MTPKQKAEQFYNQLTGQFNLVWPANYGGYLQEKGVCFIPDSNSGFLVDCGDYKGLYVAFDFDEGNANIVIDGHSITPYYTNPYKELKEIESPTVFQNFLIECLEESEELFKAFERQQSC